MRAPRPPASSATHRLHVIRGAASILLASALPVLAVPPSSAGQPPPPAASQPDPPSAAAPCDPGGLAPLLTPGRILLLGEIHGSREAPAVAAATACAAVGLGLRTVVALEMPVEEQERVDRFLASDGGGEARDALLTGDFWRRDYQDGRSSAAMLELLAALRRLAADDGGRLTVGLLDSAARFASGQQRDDVLGRRLAALAETAGPSGVLIALTGNVHSRSTPGVPWDASYRPAGTAPGDRWPERTLSILLVNPPGEAWMCPDDDAAHCGAQALGGGSDRDAGRVELYAAPEQGHDGVYHLPSLSASPPAAGPSSRVVQPRV